MTRITTMTTTTKARKRGGSADKVWAIGLAGATCVGLVGVIGVRAVSDAAAQPVELEAQLIANATPVSATGLTEAELDEYAWSLAAERQRLLDYHQQLVDAAGELGLVAGKKSDGKKKNKGSSAQSAVSGLVKPAPAAKRAPKVVPPQAMSKGS